MKYNPKICEIIAASPKIRNLHPSQNISSTQGILRILYELSCFLEEITGMAKVSLQPSAGAQAAKTLYIGGSMALTGAYAENVAAVLAAFEDYSKYVNETKRLAPWRNEKFPADITLEVLWRDDELKPAKALTIYEELKAKGMLVVQGIRLSTALALKDS
jgi:hypothetical protein